jgi:hypothetical protein
MTMRRGAARNRVGRDASRLRITRAARTSMSSRPASIIACNHTRPIGCSLYGRDASMVKQERVDGPASGG